MVKETGAEWPSKLQAAVLATNTCWKRSTDYSPFYLMFGREANCINLFSHTNITIKNEDIEDLNNIQISTNPDEEGETFSPNPEHSDEWIHPLMEARTISKTNAHGNILKEQVLQKHVYDSKVKKNRYVYVVKVLGGFLNIFAAIFRKFENMIIDFILSKFYEYLTF